MRPNLNLSTILDLFLIGYVYPKKSYGQKFLIEIQPYSKEMRDDFILFCFFGANIDSLG